MISLALSGLEKAINAYLRMDPESVQRLAKLEKKIIKIEITDWGLYFYVQPTKQGLTLSSEAKDKPNTVISGTLFNLFKTACAKDKNTALFKNSIAISGDTEIGENIRDIMAGIDIDWEEHLSKITGDVMAHQISRGFQRTMAFGKRTAQTIGDNIKEYLQIESTCVPTKKEVEQFISDVTDLQHGVDRAEARLKRLLAKRKSSS